MAENLWLQAAVWIGLALAASLISIRLLISVALVEILVGSVAGNLFALPVGPWVTFLAGVGAILLTFLAGAEVDPAVVRRHFWSSVSIGVMGFVGPFIGVMLYAHYVAGWPWPQAQIAGIALSTTSVAVVYAVMVEGGYNRTELGKIILAACFINDIGTVLALGIFFANYNLWLGLFALVTAAALWLLPRFVPWFFAQVGNRVSEPETKMLLLVLFGLGGLGAISKSEPVLPAYLVGLVMAPYFLRERILARRMRVLTFTLLSPIYFLKAGSLVRFDTVLHAAGLIAVFLGVKMLTKVVGIWPLTRAFRFTQREGTYTTLMMSTGLTFGTISALFGLTNHIITAEQYTVLVTAVIGSAVVPTLIAQRWFRPAFPLMEEDPDVSQDPARP